MSEENINVGAVNEGQKTFSEEYVRALREENKSHRINSKSYESKLKEILGTDDLNDIDNKVKGFKESLTKKEADALSKVNDRLISAEIKSTQGYNTKLVEKLLDRSKLTITENGEVQGLKEALATLEKEFPEVKVNARQNNTTGANPAGAGAGTGNSTGNMNDWIRKMSGK
jgi:hypothetical protein